ncbi:MAG: TonB-dependent receptor [Prolixibacteraceae bacterium]
MNIIKISYEKKENYFPSPIFLKVLMIFFSLLPILVNAQKATAIKLKGKIVDAKSNQPIIGATIAVVSNHLGTYSNENGFFNLNIPSDTSTLVISSIGYKTLTEKLKSNNLSSFTIKLEEDIHELDVVTVVSEKERIARISTDKISTVKMSPKLVAKLPNMGEVDVIRSFQLLPGISATNETSAGLYVRGGTPDQNLILFDGMNIYYVDHFYGFFSAFNASTIDDIELMKGGFPAKYGGRISSIMEIKGNSADMEKMKGTANLSLLSANGAIEVPVIKDKLSFLFAVRRSYTDIIRTGLYNKIFDLYNNSNNNNTPRQTFRGGMGNFNQISTVPSFYFYDLNSKLTYKLNNQHSFSFSLYNGKDNLDNSSSTSLPGFRGPGSINASTSTTSNTMSSKDIASWGNTGLSTRWNADWNSSFNTSLQLSYSDYFSNRDQKNSQSNPNSNSNTNNFSSTQSTLENNNVKDYSIRLRNQWNINQNNIMEFGWEHTLNDITYSLAYNDTSTIVNTKNKGYLSAGYLQDQILLNNKKIQLNAGVRGTYQNLTKKFYFEPRLSLSYEWIKGLKLKTAWGKYYQFCTRIIREDVLQGSKDFWLLSDGTTIPVSSAIHYIAGSSYETGDFLFSIEGYYKELSGLTEYTFRTTNTFRRGPNQTTPAYFFKGTGYAKGLEFMLQKKYGLNTGWIAYTLGEVKNTFPDLNYGKSYYANQDQTHEFKAVYCRKVKNWDFSSTFVYATGKPYTAPENRYQVTLLDGSTYTYWHVSDKNSVRLPDYHKLDLAISYNLAGIVADKTFTLSVFNVYNHENIWYKKYQISDTDITVTDVKYLGFTPNVSLTIKFK